MRFASFCAPAFRWSLTFTLLAVLSVDAQAQRLSASPAEVATSNAHVLRANHIEPGARCAVPDQNAQQIAAVRAEVEAFVARQGGTYVAGGTVTIPVAFHVVRQGTGSSNGDVPDAWITNQIQVLNDAFAGVTGGHNTNFRFELDITDRTTNAAWYTGCFGSQELPMKQALHFSPATHLNIYSCRPSSGILGYAVFPWSYPENDYRHGVVILDQSMPGGNAFPYHLGDTATHEVGHYLGLYHTFQGGCGGGDTPPGCQTGGDLVCDTAAESSPAFGCPTGRNTCGTGGPDPITNFMDYTDDSCMFLLTSGQSTRSDQIVATYKPTLLAGGGCSLSFSGTVTATVSGSSVVFAGRIVNGGSSQKSVQLRVNYTRQGGGPSGSLTYGPANLAPTGGTGVPFSINQAIPSATPPGTYNLTFELIDAASGTVCATANAAIVLTAPLTGGETEWVAAPFVFEASAATRSAATVAPNPFTGRTQIAYVVDASANVRLSVYDVLGREVAVLVDGQVEAGAHSATFDARGLAAGTYVYRLVVGNDVETGRMTVAH